MSKILFSDCKNKTFECQETGEKEEFLEIRMFFDKETYNNINYWSKKTKKNIGEILGEAYSDWIYNAEMQEKVKELQRKFDNFHQQEKHPSR